MKKLCALLLALMLPLTAMAEPFIIETTMHADASGIKMVLSPILSQIPPEYAEGMNMEAIVQLIPAILDGIGTKVCTSDDAVSIELLMKDEPLIDLVCYGMNGNTYSAITSTLIPGYALKTIAAEDENERVEALQAVFTDTDWSAIINETALIVEEWLDDLDYTEESGYFAGSVYEGGTHCVTWRFDDNDVAQIMDSILTTEVEKPLRSLCEYLNVNADDVISRCREMNASVSEKNAYHYALSLVSDETGRLVGISFAADDEDLRTLLVSVGLMGTGVKIALALPYGHNYYWCKLDLNCDQHDQNKAYSGSYSEYAAPSDMSCAYAELAGQKILSADYVLTSASTGDKATWEGRVDLNIPILSQIPGVPMDYSIHAFAESEQQQLRCELSLKTGDHSIISAELAAMPGGTIPPMEKELVFCDMADDSTENMELYYQIVEEIGKRMSVRLIKLLPLDLIFRIPDLVNFSE